MGENYNMDKLTELLLIYMRIKKEIPSMGYVAISPSKEEINDEEK